jgi:hypothetical protein
MAKRHNKKKSRGILNKLLISLTLFLLLFLTVGLHERNDDLNNQIDILIKRHNAKQERINKLEAENKSLQETLIHQHEKLKELQNTYSVKEDPETIKEPQPIHSKENQEEELKINQYSPLMDPVVIISTLIVAKEIFTGGFFKTATP